MCERIDPWFIQGCVAIKSQLHIAMGNHMQHHPYWIFHWKPRPQHFIKYIGKHGKTRGRTIRPDFNSYTPESIAIRWVYHMVSPLRYKHWTLPTAICEWGKRTRNIYVLRLVNPLGPLIVSHLMYKPWALPIVICDRPDLKYICDVVNNAKGFII